MPGGCQKGRENVSMAIRNLFFQGIPGLHGRKAEEREGKKDFQSKVSYVRG